MPVPGRPVQRPLAAGGRRPVRRRHRSRRGRHRRVPQRRRDAALRIAGRRAAGPRDDDHRRPRQHHPGARRAPGDRGDRAGGGRAADRRAGPGGGRAADRRGHRRRQARVRAGRFPRPRRARRRPRHRGGVGRRDRGPGTGGAPARPGCPLGGPGSAARAAPPSAAIGGETPAGALVFSCNGRGQSMFGATDHDATVVQSELGGSPAAGFFAAGEIGPVGGRSFLHGFTATVTGVPTLTKRGPRARPPARTGPTARPDGAAAISPRRCRAPTRRSPAPWGPRSSRGA